MSNPKPARRLIALFATGLTLVVSTPASAIEDVIELMDYTIGCGFLMLTDPADHVAKCNPKLPVPGRLTSLADPSAGPNTGGIFIAPAVPAPAPAAIPVVVPPPVVPIPPAQQQPAVDPGCGARGSLMEKGGSILVAALDFDVAQADPCRADQ